MSTALPVAIVTGAGSGIGRAIALSLAGEGYAVTLVGRRAPALEAVAGELRGTDEGPAQSLVLAVDLSEEGSAASVADATLARWGRVDLLVNNAGLAPRESLAAADAKALGRVFRTNLYAPFLLVARLWPTFEQQEVGCVINVSSVLATSPSPGFAIYAASKQALESLTRSILVESDASVRAYSVAPGAVDTPLLAGLVEGGIEAPRAPLPPEAVARVVLECVHGKWPADGHPVAVAAHADGPPGARAGGGR